MTGSFSNRLKSLWRTLLSTGFFSIAGSTVINRILSFMSGILVVRILSKADYGVYAYAYNILNIAILFNGLGFASAFIQLCSEPGGRAKEIQLERWGFIGGGFFDLLLSAGIFLWATLVPEDMPGTRMLLQVCALFPIPQFVFDMQSSALRAQLRNDEYALSNMTNTACVVAGTLAGAFLAGSVGLLVGRVLGTLASVICVRARLRVPLLLCLPPGYSEGQDAQLSRAELIDYAKIAVSSALANGISSFTYLIGTFMLGRLLADPLEVASYEAASAIPVALNFVPVTVMTYAYPYFARHKDDLAWVRRNYARILALSFVGFGIITLVCVIGAPWIVSLMYGDQYLSSVPAFRVLAIGSWIGATFRIVSGNLLVTQRLVFANLVGTTLTVASILAFNVILVPSMGSLGSAIAQTVGLSISGMFNTIVFGIKIRSK